MIHRIYSDLKSFKDVEFHKGLNILLTERDRGSSEKQTRNGAGKSSLLEIVHFLLGGKNDKDSLFRKPELISATFGMEFDLGGQHARVERCGTPRSPMLVEGDFSKWPEVPSEKDSLATLSIAKWRAVLGTLMFGVHPVAGAWGPSFRSMLGYFARRVSAGGMDDPMRSSKMQQTVDQQVNVSFLVGLDWVIPREWQGIRDQERTLKELKKSLAQGALGSVVGKASKLKSELIIEKDRATRLGNAVASFKVLDQYESLECEASQLTRELASLADENILDRRYCDELRASSLEEVPPAPDDMEELYRQAGVHLPQLIMMRFEQAQEFHESIVRNRHLYLKSELDAAVRRVSEREERRVKLDRRRAELMSLLESAGALDQFTKLQSELTRAEAHVEAIRQRYEAAEALEAGSTDLTIKRAALSEKLRREYNESDAIISEAVLIFREITTKLYEKEREGTLEINPTQNGPVFEVHLPAEKSRGVNNMRIFCFDMMLMLLSIRRGKSPGFIVHDSHLFDGVDERQVAGALSLGARLADEYGFQYLVTMNSDAVPDRFPPGFDLKRHTIPVHLSDATEEGGLFGLRFD